MTPRHGVITLAGYGISGILGYADQLFGGVEAVRGLGGGIGRNRQKRKDCSFHSLPQARLLVPEHGTEPDDKQLGASSGQLSSEVIDNTQ